MNNEAARQNMLTQQLRTWDVLDNRLLELYLKLPRELFVPQEYRGLAYADLAIPVSKHQTLLPPKEEARLLQAAEIQPDDRVLILGCGTGFIAAVVAHLAKAVYAIDFEANLVEQAEQHLKELAIDSVHLYQANPLSGLAEKAPFNVIIASQSLPEIPKEIAEQLAIGGRLIMIVGASPSMRAVRVERLTAKQFKEPVVLFETDRERLYPFKDQPPFHF